MESERVSMNTATPPKPEVADTRVSRRAKSTVTWSTCLSFALGFSPLLLLFFRNLWDRPHYQFFR